MSEVHIIYVKGKHGSCRASFTPSAGSYRPSFAEFWELLFDGSEDITEQEIVYIVFVSSNGEFTSDFSTFQDTGLDDWTTKLVAVCTDGAAVNVGVYNGVVPKLWQLAVVGDSLVHILCIAHTRGNCTKSANLQLLPYCETFNRSVVKLLQFHLQKGGAKKNCCTDEAV